LYPSNFFFFVFSIKISHVQEEEDTSFLLAGEDKGKMRQRTEAKEKQKGKKKRHWPASGLCFAFT
jgi:hypothetical protein